MINAIVITGPTASGKSELGLKIAKHYNGNATIINGDCVQIYKEIPLLSAQPKPQDLQIVKHVMYGFVGNGECLIDKYTVKKWLDQVISNISEAHKYGLMPIVVGGTGMYINALVNGISLIPTISDSIIQMANKTFEDLGYEAFLSIVVGRDVNTPQDKHRLIRNFCFLEQFNESYSVIAAKSKIILNNNINFTKIVLLPSREQIYSSCNSRFIDMISDGAIDEVCSLQNSTEPICDGILKATGFRQIKDFLNNKIPRDEMISLSQQETRRYAKRQSTWVRHKFADFQFCESQQEALAFVEKTNMM